MMKDPDQWTDQDWDKMFSEIDHQSSECLIEVLEKTEDFPLLQKYCDVLKIPHLVLGYMHYDICFKGSPKAMGTWFADRIMEGAFMQQEVEDFVLIEFPGIPLKVMRHHFYKHFYDPHLSKITSFHKFTSIDFLMVELLKAFGEKTNDNEFSDFGISFFAQNLNPKRLELLMQRKGKGRPANKMEFSFEHVTDWDKKKKVISEIYLEYGHGKNHFLVAYLYKIAFCNSKYREQFVGATSRSIATIIGSEFGIPSTTFNDIASEFNATYGPIEEFIPEKKEAYKNLCQVYDNLRLVPE